MQFRYSSEFKPSEIAQTRGLALNLFKKEEEIELKKLEFLKFLDQPAKEALVSFLKTKPAKAGDLKFIFVPQTKTFLVILFNDPEKWGMKSL
ncbi:MAG: hypothetical protein ACK4NX_03630, partial [Candidatus Paceibacteria bacterium]